MRILESLSKENNHILLSIGMETTLITWDETAINCANKKKEVMDNETSHGPLQDSSET